MTKTSFNFLLGVVFIFGILFASGFTSAVFVDCFGQEPQFGGTRTSCNALGCLWASDNATEETLNITDVYDDFCTHDDDYCCFPDGCWQYDDNSTYCAANSGSLNCTWDALEGECFDDFVNSGDWGGVQDGCWQNDGDEDACSSGDNAAKCTWSSNSNNQNPWCGIKSLTDAQNKNPFATSTDIGCCEQKSCWNYDNNESSCNLAFQGNCFYQNNTYGGGWCNTKSCSEVSTEDNCTYLQQNLYMPCSWTGSACEGSVGGGFDFYSDDTDSCFDAGGWYNSSGSCVMPSGGGFEGGSGGFLFGGETHCWFADNQPNVCGNITGCAYCIAGTGPFGTGNSSSDNICNGKQVGFCEGHSLGDSIYSNANNSANLACDDINIKTACNYGPLPNCKWTNSSVILGAYCEVGTSSEKKSTPPVQYCEDPLAKNNYSLCLQLSENYMMPCVWENSTTPVKNCTFNDNAVFGTGGGEKDFGVINSEFSCTSAGGNWNTEYYVDGGVLKQDSWCEMGGFFDIDQGQGFNNKMNCDASCWACEFQSDGSAWADVSVAEAACEGSVAVGGSSGGCVWINSSNSFNGLGFCDFPKEMEDGGAKDCNFECEGCNFAGDPQGACEASVANSGCQWVSEGSSNYCVDSTKKVCTNDCFSCYEVDSCQNSSLSCSWDNGAGICSPVGFTGEVCFDGIDNDADNFVDCDDPDCGFDNFCGGASFGGDCFAQATEGTCNQTLAFDSLNCTWVNSSWDPDGWCDMPGSNCWTFDDDLATCGVTPGCTNDSSSLGDDAWCEMNWTKMETTNCWNNNNESACGVATDCQWVNDTWCAENPSDQWCLDNSAAGFCDYAPFASCMNSNESVCGANVNCTWQQDDYSEQGGWCDVACFDWDLNQSACGAAMGGAGLCEWRNMSATCQPSTFISFGKKDTNGKSGCWQYDGNQTLCLENDVTCTYKNDTYSNNNVSAGEPAGWCMGKAEHEHFGEMEGDVIDLAFDADNFAGAETGVSDEVDLIGMGMRVTDSGFNFGAGIFNISDSIICNGYEVGNPDNPFAAKTQANGNSTSRFYWFLDTSGNSSDGCVAVQSGGAANLTGFDFMVSYVARNTTTGPTETKQLMRCLNDAWVPTNALVTTSKKLSCGEIGGVMVAIAKQDIESFSEYNKTANMKIFMSSANDTDSRDSPTDSIGPGYYTPGTVDFAFVDCSDPENSKDSKCKNFQKFGFNVYEECKNGVDDDENGLIDCDDPFCSFIPDCNAGVGFSFVSDSNDATAPVVMFSDIDRLSDSAFVKVDTSEPSNLSLQFYLTDSGCEEINTTVSDVGTGYQANANFKPFHSVDLIEDNLGYTLVNDTAYYYKIKVCDPSNNCGVSECSNFTTKSAASTKSFIFKMDLPDGFTVDIPALNKTGYNFTETFNISGNLTSFDVGIKTNTSITKSMNMTFHCGDMSIGFYGMNVLEPTDIDLSNAFICDEDEDLIGMNSTGKKWNKLVNDLRLGGAEDYIEIGIPLAYSASNTFNWTDDAGAGGQDVDDYVECSGNTTETNCKVPVSMGFSAYTVSVPAATPAGDSGSSGGSGGGSSGGSGGVATTASNATVAADAEAEIDSGAAPSDSPSDSPVEGENAEDVIGDVIEGANKVWLWVSVTLILLLAVVAVFFVNKKK